MRKDLDLDVEATIDIMIKTTSKFKDLVMPQIKFIMNEVRARTLIVSDIEDCETCELTKNDDPTHYRKNWNIEDEEVCIHIIKL